MKYMRLTHVLFCSAPAPADANKIPLPVFLGADWECLFGVSFLESCVCVFLFFLDMFDYVTYSFFFRFLVLRGRVGCCLTLSPVSFSVLGGHCSVQCYIFSVFIFFFLGFGWPSVFFVFKALAKCERSTAVPTSSGHTHSAAPKSSGHAEKTKSSTSRAYMMTVEGSRSSASSSQLGGPTSSGGRQLYHPKLETVDLATDSRVFALLDEGCNTSCHGTEWIKHAIDAFQKAGAHNLVGELDSSQSKRHKGLGSRQSLGTHAIALNILYKCEAKDGICCSQGTIRSNEIPGDMPLLISLHAQSTLGFIKDVEEGTCFMKYRNGGNPDGVELVEITLYNAGGSGLRAICISDFPDDVSMDAIQRHEGPMTFAAVDRTSHRNASRSASTRAQSDSARDDRPPPETSRIRRLSRGRLLDAGDFYADIRREREPEQEQESEYWGPTRDIFLRAEPRPEKEFIQSAVRSCEDRRIH